MGRKSFSYLFPAIVLALTLNFAFGASESFQWQGMVSPGQSIEIKGVNGNIDSAPSSGSEVGVYAVKSGVRNDPSEVQIQVISHEGGVTICVVYPDVEAACEPGKGGRLGARNNDVEVNFEVRVPDGVRFVGRTVNGDVSAVELQAYAEGYTVNGSVELECDGVARAKTVNGSIKASMQSIDAPEDLAFETVNGSVYLALPSGLNADVEAQVLNGHIDSEFPITVTGRWGPKRASGTIGSGGQKLTVQTVNGNIELSVAGR